MFINRVATARIVIGTCDVQVSHCSILIAYCLAVNIDVCSKTHEQVKLALVYKTIL